MNGHPAPATAGGGPWRRAVRAGRRWRTERSLRQRLKAVGFLLTGNLAGSILGLVAFALTARALGPQAYGILALVHAYTRLIERFISFQSWQPMIKFGAELQEQGRRRDLQSLLKLGFLLDLATALAAWALAFAGALLAAPWFEWSAETSGLLALYCAILLFNASGTPTAVLRLFGRFRTVAIGQVGNAALRLFLCGIGFWLGYGLWYFAAAWVIVHGLGSMATVGLALHELHRQKLLAGLADAPVRGIERRFPGLWSFAWSANLSLTIRASANELDTLIIGAFAGSAAAGLYHIAKRVARLAQQVGVQVQSVLYPDVARLWAATALPAFRRAVLQVEVLLAAFGCGCLLLAALLAEPFLRLTAGPGFLDAAPLLVVQMLAAGLMLTGSAVRSGLLAMGRQRDVLFSALAGTAAFYATALALVPAIGAMGANIAHVVLNLVLLVGMTRAFRRGLALARSRAATAPPPGTGIGDVTAA